MEKVEIILYKNNWNCVLSLTYIRINFFSWNWGDPFNNISKTFDWNMSGTQLINMDAWDMFSELSRLFPLWDWSSRENDKDLLINNYFRLMIFPIVTSLLAQRMKMKKLLRRRHILVHEISKTWRWKRTLKTKGYHLPSCC